jgi:hypothetical protein
MAFELFTSSRAPTEPFISLVKEGFRLSAAFARGNHLESAKAVQLYYDRGKCSVGFSFPKTAAAKDGTFRPKRHAGGFVIRTQGFFRVQGINPAAYAGRYRPREVKDRAFKRLFVIQLRRRSAKA